MFFFCRALLTILIFAVLFVWTSRNVRSQELGFGGLGATNHAVAGATAAMPLDGSGAMHWNPATLGVLDLGEVQFGFGRIDGPWFGDESVLYTVLIPITAVCWLMDKQDQFEDWLDGDRRTDKNTSAKNEDGGENLSGFQQKSPKVRGLNFSFTLPADRHRHWNFGFGLSEIGSRKYRFETDENGQILGARLYRVKTVEFTPTMTWRFGKRFYLGFTPIMSLTEHPNASLPMLQNFETESDAGHCAFGLQLGAFYETKYGFNIGFSVRSSHWLSSAETVQWIGSENELLERKLRYSTEEPMRYVFGISYTGFKRFKMSIDVRHYDFQHLSSLYGVSEASVCKRATSYATGLQFSPNPESFPMVFRIGYQFNDSAVTLEDYYYNITPPIAKGHSIHYGIAFGIPESKGIEFAFSVSHSFGSGRYYYETSSGQDSFRRNPNQNAFWWDVRFKY